MVAETFSARTAPVGHQKTGLADVIEQNELLQIFLLESDDLLKMAEASLLTLESSPEDMAPVNELFRAVHTLKSSAAMVKLLHLSEYAHHLENLLERLRSHKLAISKSLITFLLDSVDYARLLVEQAVTGTEEVDVAALSQRQDQIKRYLGLDAVGVGEELEEESPSVPAAARETSTEAQAPSDQVRFLQIRMRFRKDILHTGRDPLLTLLNLSELGEFIHVTADWRHLPAFTDLDPYQLYISWEVVLKTARGDEEVEEVFFFVKDDNEIHIEDVTGRFQESTDTRLAHETLGELLVERGDVTASDVVEALKTQKKLGEILVEQGKLKPETLLQAVAIQHESRSQYRQTTIRVTVDKLNNLVNIAEEMGIGLSRLQVFAKQHGAATATELMEEMENLLKVNLEFQERVARVRLFPLEGTFRRFQRMARDLALQQNKSLKVNVAGLENELDKEVIEHITDPLKHLIRNCVDHGIETPEERLLKGKTAEANMELKAYQREGRIFIEIKDDGRGFDWPAIHRKALELDFITADQPVHPDILLPLVFRPGFSTRSDLTELSGRGIGLDVVKTELEQLGGTISVSTEKDVGTSFTLCLPLTFSLMEVLHVRIGERSYLIPLQNVVGTEKFQPHLLRPVGQDDTLYRFRSTYVPLVTLSKIFGERDLKEEAPAPILVFMNTGEKILGIPVDELLEPQQIVIKSLETNFRSVTGLAGAAIVGDGSVALVLDPPGLEQLCFGLEG
jgi:two-component system, chemotaxis family, sensor kinase CheA